ncbi:MAG: Ig-like domain-containing protein [Oscillospiraceae bacterium]|jgi:hypothetical protein|nr:Ig-like domain-containing protein [Oscillospiraceae bacterium]
MKSLSNALALLAALALVIGAVPVSAYAEGSGDEQLTVESTADTGDTESEASALDIAAADEATERAVSITIAPGELGDTALRIPQGEPVTDKDLLAGVTAVDENCDPAPVAVSDVGGLTLDNPQPKGEPGSPEAYIITYTCGESVQATRDCYVTVAFMPLASGGSVIEMDDPNPPASGTGWTSTKYAYTILDSAKVMVTGDNAGSGWSVYVPINAKVEITFDNVTMTGTYYGFGERSFSPLLISGSVTLNLVGDNTISDGKYFPGIQVLDKGSLTIVSSSGSLSVTGGSGSADIGGAPYGSCGNITIEDGAKINGTPRIGAGNGGIITGTITIPVKSVAIGNDFELAVGGTKDLIATIDPKYASVKEWTSSDPAVATVDQDGLVTAIKAGTATITASTVGSSVTGECTVTVKAKPEPPKPTPPRPSYNDSDDDDNDDSPYTPPRAPTPTHTLRKGDGYYDTMRGRAVELRLYADLPVLGYTSSTAADNIQKLFEKYFSNKIRVIHFDQPGKWEKPVKIAAKIDLAGMDTTRLVFYAYDREANSYRRIASPAYWIDANGYLRFTTEFAGDIVISEGELTK